jgi:hypothetical protein
MIASATVQRVPRVGIVLSSYKGGGDHFGNATFTGVPEPRPPEAELTDTQLRALTRRAIELANHPNTNLRRIVGREEAVMLLVNRHTEPAVVSAVIEIVKENAAGSRITIVSDAASRFSGAQVVDVASAPSVRMPAPGVWSRREVTYRIPKVLIDSDRLISIAPLNVQNGRPSLTMDNYRTLLPADSAPNDPPDVTALDLYGFLPAEFVVLGGSHVVRDGNKVRHNLVLAGYVPVAVDTIGAAVLNLKPGSVRLFQTAKERGFGESSLGAIWTLGNEIKDARVPS